MGHFHSANLPLCQTPSQKRTYTKAHSLNVHLLDLCPESTEIWQQGKEDKERERKKETRIERARERERKRERKVQNTKTMRLNDDVT